MPVKGNAAFLWTTPAGQESVHLLGAPLRDLRPAIARESFTHWSADNTQANTVSVGAGVWDLTATLRFDQLPRSLLRMLRDGADQQTLTYVHDLTAPGDTFDAQIVPGGTPIQAVPDPDMWWNAMYQVEVRLRRTDGGTFEGLEAATVGGAKVVLQHKGGEPIEDWTLARTVVSGADTYRTRDAALAELATNNIARTEWLDLDADGILETPAWLLEDQGENLVAESEDFTTWSTSGSPVLSASQRAPDQTTGAYVVQDDSGSTQEYIYDTPNFTGDGEKGVSLFVKEATMPASGVQRIAIQDTTAGQPRLEIDITAWDSAGKPSITETTGTLLGMQRYYDSVGGVWWRLLMQTTSVTAANTHQFRIIPAETAAQTGTLRIFGAQAEDGPFPSSYIATAGATVTRNAEAGQISLPGSVSKPTALSIYLRFEERGTSTEGDFSRLFSIGGNINNQTLCVFDASGVGTYRVRSDNGTDFSAQTAENTVAFGDIVEAVVTFTAAGVATLYVSVNEGATVASPATSAIAPIGEWNAANLYLNCSTPGTLNGHAAFRDVVMCKGVVSATDPVAAFRRYVDGPLAA